MNKKFFTAPLNNGRWAVMQNNGFHAPTLVLSLAKEQAEVCAIELNEIVRCYNEMFNKASTQSDTSNQ